MDALSEKERKKYETVWKSLPEYRENSAADYLVPEFLLHFQSQIQKGQTIIDFGCGTARTAPLLTAASLQVVLIDICVDSLDPEIFLETFSSKPAYTFFQESLWELSEKVRPADWFICFDVMEHLPEEKIESALEGFAKRTKLGGAFSIGLCEDLSGKLIGETLHLTIKPASWWLDRIERHFKICKKHVLDEAWLILYVAR